MKTPMNTFAERAWYAYQCLPRTKGRLPSMESLMGKSGKVTLSNLFHGRREDAREPTRIAIAQAFNVSRAWLDHNEGPPPTLTGPYKPMPRDEELREQDPAEWARKYEAMGGSTGGNPNNFQIAVLFYGSSLSAEAIEEVAKEARGKEDLRPPMEWGRRLRVAQDRVMGDAFKLGGPQALAAVPGRASAKKPAAKKRHAG